MESEEKPGVSEPLATRQPHDKPPQQFEDGRSVLLKLFVENKHLSLGDFNACWPVVHAHEPLRHIVEPFIQVLADRQLLPVETSLKLILDKSRLCFLPLEKYDIDVDLARSFPREICQRWCVLPFDQMSKSLLVATTNPFNKQASYDLESFSGNRVLWYVVTPGELLKLLRKVFR
jgi:hypothetical protein